MKKKLIKVSRDERKILEQARRILRKGGYKIVISIR